jgi:integrase
MRTYHEALGSLQQDRAATRARPGYGTLRWLVGQYLASRHYRDLAQSTRRWQRYHLENLCEEVLSADDPRLLGDLLADMPPSAVRRLRDRKADASGVQSGNHRLKSMKALYRWGTEQGLVQHDPAREIRKIAAKSEGHHTWTPEKVEQFIARWRLGTSAHLALSILLYTGARRSDVVMLGRQHVRDGWLVFHPVKNGGRVTVEVPILPELAEAIEAATTGNLTFLVTAHGKPYSAKGFGARFRA